MPKFPRLPTTLAIGIPEIVSVMGIYLQVSSRARTFNNNSVAPVIN